MPKIDRQVVIANLYPEYNIELDRGGDISDAMGLGVWYLQEQKIKLAGGKP